MTNGNYEGWTKEPIQSCLHFKGKQSMVSHFRQLVNINTHTHSNQIILNQHQMIIINLLRIFTYTAAYRAQILLLHRLQHTKIKSTSTIAINYKPLILMHFAERRGSMLLACTYSRQLKGLTFFGAMTMYSISRNSSCDLPCHTVSCYLNWCANDSQWTWTHRERYVEYPCCCEMFFFFRWFS